MREGREGSIQGKEEGEAGEVKVPLGVEPLDLVLILSKATNGGGFLELLLLEHLPHRLWGGEAKRREPFVTLQGEQQGKKRTLTDEGDEDDDEANIDGELEIGHDGGGRPPSQHRLPSAGQGWRHENRRKREKRKKLLEKHKYQRRTKEAADSKDIETMTSYSIKGNSLESSASQAGPAGD